VTIGERYREREAENVPGPGEYKYMIEDTHGGWTIAEKRQTKIEQTPGPGDFNPKDIKKHEGASTFGQSRVEKGIKVGGDEMEPGPGYYRYEKPETKSKGFTMGTKRKQKVETGAPGPGSYISQNDWAPGFGYSVQSSAKFVEMVPEEFAGEERYDASEMYKMRRNQEKIIKEERKRGSGYEGSYGGHEGEKLITKSYAYEIDPTVEVTHERSGGKSSMKKSAGYEYSSGYKVKSQKYEFIRWLNGEWIEGRWIEGVWTIGFWIDGEWVEWSDGCKYSYSNGRWLDSFWVEGRWLEGKFVSGRWVEGVWSVGA
jgi:hypothetical protein